ncbi:vanadium-dependent haloperoxidase [Hymenobacter sp. YC55]|uniref:vanadium-dependent haloperoxidase n=1 Tax=Hymenobacter sp. YC55 TaxID=3034019 RepID=UPI0023F7A0E4|nr:vanadium-dependent haloperoxidase [Hymenobacter sp. YC55]MDF7815926.1 vanadium-dependent haloperoxidase [Hymenobacter sp. YC55]
MLLRALETLPKKASLLGLLLAALLFSGCDDWFEHLFPAGTPSPPERATVVYDWYKLVARTQLRVSPQPVILLNNRNFGYIGVGLYEAVRPGLKGARSLSPQLYQMPAMPVPERNREYVWGASANAALASLFKQLLGGLSAADIARIDSLETAYTRRFQQSASAATVARSQAYGRAVAQAIYLWSTTDNFSLGSQGYVLPVFPGSWVPTPPAFAAPQGPYLKNSRPFLASSLTATAPPLPLAYAEDPASAFYQQAHTVYAVGKALTPEQQAIATWWADAGGAGVGVPAPYHTLSIITGLLEGKRAQLAEAAEVYAKTGIAMKDGPIVTFRAKYEYNLLRPVTYIQRHIDPAWQAYLPTPPYPEYPSGLVGIAAPVMQVLIRECGDLPVTDNAYAWRGVAPRTYASISVMLEEAAYSRVYAGLHYPFTQVVSVAMGKELGNKIANLTLRPR